MEGFQPNCLLPTAALLLLGIGDWCGSSVLAASASTGALGLQDSTTILIVTAAILWCLVLFVVMLAILYFLNYCFSRKAKPHVAYGCDETDDRKHLSDKSQGNDKQVSTYYVYIDPSDGLENNSSRKEVSKTFSAPRPSYGAM